MSRRRKANGKRRAVVGNTSPLRMCASCRSHAAPETLLRFVRGPDGVVAFDVRGTLDSRGVYTCSTPACLVPARDRGAFQRGFDEPVLFSDDFSDSIREVLEGEIANLFALHRKAQKVEAGFDRVIARGSKNVYVVLAHDLAGNTARKVSEAVEPDRVVLGPKKSQLGLIFGRETVGVVGIGNLGGATIRLRRELQRWGSITELVQSGTSVPCGLEKEGVQASEGSTVTP